MNGVRMKVFSVALGRGKLWLLVVIGERERDGRLLDEVCHRYKRRGKTNSRTVKRHDENLWVLEERPGELQIIRRDYAHPSASLLLHRARLKSAYKNVHPLKKFFRSLSSFPSPTLKDTSAPLHSYSLHQSVSQQLVTPLTRLNH